MAARTIAVSFLVAKASPGRFGPGQCVSVSRSEEGSCVIETQCGGQQTDAFEFAFDCALPNGAVERHSYGQGGFDAEENYDTEVKCTDCSPPTGPNPSYPLARVAGSAAAAPVHLTASHTAKEKKEDYWSTGLTMPSMGSLTGSSSKDAKAQGKAKGWFTPAPSKEDEEGAHVERFGPSKCASVFKSREGYCVLHAQCKGVDISEYDFGLVCIDNLGRPVQHNFGKGSFHEEEVFNTMISCNECVSPEAVPEHIMLNNEVIGLADAIKDVQGMLDDITKSVTTLNDKVFPKSTAPAPGPDAAPAPAVALHTRKKVQHQKVQQKMHHQQKHKKGRKVKKHLRGKKHNKGHHALAAHHSHKQNGHKHPTQKHEEVDEVQEPEQEDIRSTTVEVPTTTTITTTTTATATAMVATTTLQIEEQAIDDQSDSDGQATSNEDSQVQPIQSAEDPEHPVPHIMPRAEQESEYSDSPPPSGQSGPYRQQADELTAPSVSTASFRRHFSFGGHRHLQEEAWDMPPPTNLASALSAGMVRDR